MAVLEDIRVNAITADWRRGVDFTLVRSNSRQHL